MTTNKLKLDYLSDRNTYPIAMCLLYLLLSYFIPTIITDVIFLFLFSVYWFSYKRDHPYSDTKIVFPNSIRCIGITCICFCFLSAYLCTSWYMNAHTMSESATRYTDAMGSLPIYIYLIVTCVAAPLGEEALFRGFIFHGLFYYFRGLKKFDRILLSVMLSSIMFAAMHGTDVHLIPGFFCGIAFCLSYFISGRLSTAIAMHFIYNFGTLFVSVPCNVGFCIQSIFISILLLFVCISEINRYTDYVFYLK